MFHVKPLSARLTRLVHESWPAGSVAAVVAALTDLPARLPSADGQDPERLQAALVLLADGRWTAWDEAVALARTDWRDLLVAAGLADADWRAVLDARLGPP